MAPVFEEIEMQWKGATYKVTPDMALVNKIEQRNGIARLLTRIEDGDPPMGLLAEVLRTVLVHAGCKKVTWDEAYEEIYEGPSAIVMVAKILRAMLPRKIFKGNASAPEEGAESTKSHQTSTGEKSTTSPSDTSVFSRPNSGG